MTKAQVGLIGYSTIGALSCLQKPSQYAEISPGPYQRERLMYGACSSPQSPVLLLKARFRPAHACARNPRSASSAANPLPRQGPWRPRAVMRAEDRKQSLDTVPAGRGVLSWWLWQCSSYSDTTVLFKNQMFRTRSLSIQNRF